MARNPDTIGAHLDDILESPVKQTRRAKRRAPAAAVPVEASRIESDISPEKPWFVYLLVCRGDRLYAGVTPDLAARMRKHRSGSGAKFTRSHPPEVLLAAKLFASKAAALSMEVQVKRMRAAAKRALALTWAQEHEISADVRALLAAPNVP